MNREQPPLSLSAPQVEDRRRESRPIPLPAERVAARAETARALSDMVGQINNELSRLDEGARQAQLVKLEHDRPIDLSGTGLKPLGTQGTHVTVAVLKKGEPGLGRLQKKITEFGSGPMHRGQPKNKQIDNIRAVRKGEPKDRLSDALFNRYEEKVSSKEPFFIEIEITSLLQGPKQQREEIKAILQQLQCAFQFGRHGDLFEHEEVGNTCRAVIRCTGELFKRLVEDSSWVRKIAWFEERPRFQTFREITESFRAEGLGEFVPPPPHAPTVCVIDSGITPQNPFLKPVTRTDLLKSFLSSDPGNPYDSFGHGSGVASLVAYNVLNITPGAVNEGKVWIASARIVTAKEELEDDRLFSLLLKDVVEYFKPRGVRIFNLSVGNNQLYLARPAVTQLSVAGTPISYR